MKKIFFLFFSFLLFLPSSSYSIVLPPFSLPHPPKKISDCLTFFGDYQKSLLEFQTFKDRLFFQKITVNHFSGNPYSTSQIDLERLDPFEGSVHLFLFYFSPENELHSIQVECQQNQNTLISEVKPVDPLFIFQKEENPNDENFLFFKTPKQEKSTSSFPLESIDPKTFSYMLVPLENLQDLGVPFSLGFVLQNLFRNYPRIKISSLKGQKEFTLQNGKKFFPIAFREFSLPNLIFPKSSSPLPSENPDYFYAAQGVYYLIYENQQWLWKIHLPIVLFSNEFKLFKKDEPIRLTIVHSDHEVAFFTMGLDQPFQDPFVPIPN